MSDHQQRRDVVGDLADALADQLGRAEIQSFHVLHRHRFTVGAA